MKKKIKIFKGSGYINLENISNANNPNNPNNVNYDKTKKLNNLILLKGGDKVPKSKPSRVSTTPTKRTGVFTLPDFRKKSREATKKSMNIKKVAQGQMQLNKAHEDYGKRAEKTAVIKEKLLDSQTKLNAAHAKLESVKKEAAEITFGNSKTADLRKAEDDVKTHQSWVNGHTKKLSESEAKLEKRSANISKKSGNLQGARKGVRLFTNRSSTGTKTHNQGQEGHVKNTNTSGKSSRGSAPSIAHNSPILNSMTRYEPGQAQKVGESSDVQRLTNERSREMEKEIQGYMIDKKLSGHRWEAKREWRQNMEKQKQIENTTKKIESNKNNLRALKKKLVKAQNPKAQKKGFLGKLSRLFSFRTLDANKIQKEIAKKESKILTKEYKIKNLEQTSKKTKKQELYETLVKQEQGKIDLTKFANSNPTKRFSSNNGELRNKNGSPPAYDKHTENARHSNNASTIRAEQPAYGTSPRTRLPGYSKTGLPQNSTTTVKNETTEKLNATQPNNTKLNATKPNNIKPTNAAVKNTKKLSKAELEVNVKAKRNALNQKHEELEKAEGAKKTKEEEHDKQKTELAAKHTETEKGFNTKKTELAQKEEGFKKTEASHKEEEEKLATEEKAKVDEFSKKEEAHKAETNKTDAKIAKEAAEFDAKIAATNNLGEKSKIIAEKAAFTSQTAQIKQHSAELAQAIAKEKTEQMKQIETKKTELETKKKALETEKTQADEEKKKLEDNTSKAKNAKEKESAALAATHKAELNAHEKEITGHKTSIASHKNNLAATRNALNDHSIKNATKKSTSTVQKLTPEEWSMKNKMRTLGKLKHIAEESKKYKEKLAELEADPNPGSSKKQRIINYKNYINRREGWITLAVEKANKDKYSPEIMQEKEEKIGIIKKNEEILRSKTATPEEKESAKAQIKQTRSEVVNLAEKMIEITQTDITEKQKVISEKKKPVEEQSLEYRQKGLNEKHTTNISRKVAIEDKTAELAQIESKRKALQAPLSKDESDQLSALKKKMEQQESLPSNNRKMLSSNNKKALKEMEKLFAQENIPSNTREKLEIDYNKLKARESSVLSPKEEKLLAQLTKKEETPKKLSSAEQRKLDYYLGKQTSLMQNKVMLEEKQAQLSPPKKVEISENEKTQIFKNQTETAAHLNRLLEDKRKNENSPSIQKNKNQQNQNIRISSKMEKKHGTLEQHQEKINAAAKEIEKKETVLKTTLEGLKKVPENESPDDKAARIEDIKIYSDMLKETRAPLNKLEQEFKQRQKIAERNDTRVVKEKEREIRNMQISAAESKLQQANERANSVLPKQEYTNDKKNITTGSETHTNIPQEKEGQQSNVVNVKPTIKVLEKSTTDESSDTNTNTNTAGTEKIVSPTKPGTSPGTTQNNYLTIGNGNNVKSTNGKKPQVSAQNEEAGYMDLGAPTKTKAQEENTYLTIGNNKVEKLATPVVKTQVPEHIQKHTENFLKKGFKKEDGTLFTQKDLEDIQTKHQNYLDAAQKVHDYQESYHQTSDPGYEKMIHNATEAKHAYQKSIPNLVDAQNKDIHKTNSNNIKIFGGIITQGKTPADYASGFEYISKGSDFEKEKLAELEKKDPKKAEVVKQKAEVMKKDTEEFLTKGLKMKNGTSFTPENIENMKKNYGAYMEAEQKLKEFQDDPEHKNFSAPDLRGERTKQYKKLVEELDAAEAKAFMPQMKDVDPNSNDAKRLAYIITDGKQFNKYSDQNPYDKQFRDMHGLTKNKEAATTNTEVKKTESEELKQSPVDNAQKPITHNQTAIAQTPAPQEPTAATVTVTQPATPEPTTTTSTSATTETPQAPTVSRVLTNEEKAAKKLENNNSKAKQAKLIEEAEKIKEQIKNVNSKEVSTQNTIGKEILNARNARNKKENENRNARKIVLNASINKKFKEIQTRKTAQAEELKRAEEQQNKQKGALAAPKTTQPQTTNTKPQSNQNKQRAKFAERFGVTSKNVNSKINKKNTKKNPVST